MPKLEEFPYQGFYLLYRSGDTIAAVRPGEDLTDEQFAWTRDFVKETARAQEEGRSPKAETYQWPFGSI